MSCWDEIARVSPKIISLSQCQCVTSLVPKKKPPGFSHQFWRRNPRSSILPWRLPKPAWSSGKQVSRLNERTFTPKSSILIGFSIINHPFWGTPILGNTHLTFTSQLWTSVWAPQNITMLKLGKMLHLWIHHENQVQWTNQEGSRPSNPKFYQGVLKDEGSKFVWDQQVVKVDGDGHSHVLVYHGRDSYSPPNLGVAIAPKLGVFTRKIWSGLSSDPVLGESYFLRWTRWSRWIVWYGCCGTCGICGWYQNTKSPSTKLFL